MVVCVEAENKAKMLQDGVQHEALNAKQTGSGFVQFVFENGATWDSEVPELNLVQQSRCMGRPAAAPTASKVCKSSPSKLAFSRAYHGATKIFKQECADKGQPVEPEALKAFCRAAGRQAAEGLQ